MTTQRDTAVIARFLAKFSIVASGCWEWNACIAENGYGLFWGFERQEGAHRFSYKLFKGIIPDRLQIDHLCRNRSCVNPDHMELTTGRENVLRGIGVTANNAHKTHCPKGHPYDSVNTYLKHRKGNIERHCRLCNVLRMRRVRRCKKISNNLC